MIGGRQVVAVVPARSGSKGIVDKNLRPLSGVPLLGIAIRQARASALVDRVLVSTDAERYAVLAREHGGEVPFLRPAALAGDAANPADAVLDLLGRLGGYDDEDLVVLVEPTSPLREAGLIDRAVRQLVASPGLSGVVSVSVLNATHPDYLLVPSVDGVRLESWLTGARDGAYLPRQGLRQVYYLDGNVYVVRLGALAASRSFQDTDTGFVVSREGTALEIDTPTDLVCAEALYLYFQARSTS